MLSDDLVSLRPPRPDDRELLARLRNDPALQSGLLALPRANSSRRVDEWVEGVLADPASLFFVIAPRPGDSAAGFVQLRKMDFVHRHGELGIALAQESRGKGCAAAAIRLVERHARAVFGLRKVVLQVLASNRRAVALYQRCGYGPAGVLRLHFYHDGGFHDVALMEHLLGDEP